LNRLVLISLSLVLSLLLLSCSHKPEVKVEKKQAKSIPQEEINTIKDFVKKKELLQAEAHIALLRQEYTESGELDFLYGIVLFNQEDYSRALEMLQSAENKGYNDWVLNLIMANTYELLGDVARAKYRYRLIIKQQKEQGQDYKTIEKRVHILTNLQTIKDETAEPIYLIRKGIRLCEEEKNKEALQAFLLGLGRFYYFQEQGVTTWAPNQSELEWLKTINDNLYKNDPITHAKWKEFQDYCFEERFSGLFEYLEALYSLDFTL
jgi:hypothetical protein